MSFWQRLPKPFFASAPMKDVTDPAFRGLIARYGKPDVMWTEFVSADGLFHTREMQHISDAQNPLLRDLYYVENERPIVAQIFSSSPEMIAYTSRLVETLGFDGVDINMGCPDRSVEKTGAGAALVKNAEQARTLIKAAKAATKLPVSVKTRIGYHADTLQDWLSALLEEAPAAITLHLRTRKELSLVPAQWGRMKEAVAIRNRINPEVLLIGNGDVKNREQGEILAKETGCDGIMIGRGMFGNPWVFANTMSITLDEKLKALIDLAYEFEKVTPSKPFAIFKKHIKAFVSGFDGAADFRLKIMKTESAEALEQVIRNQL